MTDSKEFAKRYHRIFKGDYVKYIKLMRRASKPEGIRAVPLSVWLML